MNQKLCSKLDVPTLVAFHLYHQQISSLISAVVSKHRASDGDGLKVPAILSSVEYALVANNAPWPYGKRWKFHWGNEPVKPSLIKWVFTVVDIIIRDSLKSSSKQTSTTHIKIRLRHKEQNSETTQGTW
ncbi:hypothetical protein BS47DRAFT_505289 [Hydnum rufescens UP504]|uniref:Uncharacterized protein n=1 Tax=Hydnum rufescens UP504 TaxID=1448309 RepID=A0A9P6B4G4_9AGAM|nr:hypothetical protein BS47DRAFT_505289 [Hydnum rufescens UP504]